MPPVGPTRTAQDERKAVAPGFGSADITQHLERFARGGRVRVVAVVDHGDAVGQPDDFSPMRGNWAHRFLICSDRDVENAAFVAYGAKFAELLDLPGQVTAIIPLSRQLPDRYLPLFAEGCSNAMSKQVSAQFSGSFDHGFQVELFRAVFLPIRLHQSWSKWLIFGSFNYRMVLSTDKQAL